MEPGKRQETLPKRQDGGRGLKSMRDVYKQGYEWHDACQSWKIGGSKLPGEGKH